MHMHAHTLVHFTCASVRAFVLGQQQSNRRAAAVAVVEAAAIAASSVSRVSRESAPVAEIRARVCVQWTWIEGV